MKAIIGAVLLLWLPASYADDHCLDLPAPGPLCRCAIADSWSLWDSYGECVRHVRELMKPPTRQECVEYWERGVFGVEGGEKVEAKCINLYGEDFYRSGAPHSTEPEVVRRLQTLLSRLGYDVGPIDGTAGERTASAFEAAARDYPHLADYRPLSAEMVDQLQIIIESRAAPPDSTVETKSGDYQACMGWCMAQHDSFDYCHGICR